MKGLERHLSQYTYDTQEKHMVTIEYKFDSVSATKTEQYNTMEEALAVAVEMLQDGYIVQVYEE
jgi:hypothetical protein